MRKLALICAGFCLAMLAALYVNTVFWRLLLAAGLFVLGTAGLLLPERLRLRARTALFSAAVGMLWSGLYLYFFVAPVYTLDGQSVSATAVVTNFVQETDYGCRVDVRADVGGRFPVKTRLYVFDSSLSAEPGDHLTFTAELDAADTLYGEETDVFTAKGVFLFAAVSDGADIAVTEGSGAPYFYRYIGRALQEKITEIFPADVRAFVLALLTGERTELYADAGLNDGMQICGVSHVVAVSGMHVSFLVGAVTLLFGRRRRVSLFVIPVILLFMAVTGFTPSVVRAGIMNIFLLLAPLAKRESDGLTSLLTAAALIVLVNPYAAASVSLQLSFSACLGMIVLSGGMYAALAHRVKTWGLYANRWGKRFLQGVLASFVTSAGASVFTIPLVVLNFGYISLLSPVVNLLVLWAVSLLFVLALAACIAGFLLGPLGVGIAWVAAWAARYFLLVVEVCAQIPFAAIYTGNRYMLFWLAYVYLMLLFWFAVRGRPRDLLKIGGSAVLSLCVIFLLSHYSYESDSLTFTALDVGQGQCLVLTSGDAVVLVDCGSGNGRDAAAAAKAYLGRTGRRKIDLLVLTHFHTDHTSGVTALLEILDVAAIAMPDPAISEEELSEEILRLARTKKIDIIYVTEDRALTLGDATWTLFAPIGDTSENERGVVLLCTQGDNDVLITGDAGTETEKRLVYTKKLPDIELLVAGHHGSRYATCAALLETVTPELAVISVGFNSYGHPSAEVLARLTEKNIVVYRTDEQGSVSITMR